VEKLTVQSAMVDLDLSILCNLENVFACHLLLHQSGWWNQESM